LQAIIPFLTAEPVPLQISLSSSQCQPMLYALIDGGKRAHYRGAVYFGSTTNIDWLTSRAAAVRRVELSRHQPKAYIFHQTVVTRLRQQVADEVFTLISVSCKLSSNLVTFKCQFVLPSPNEAGSPPLNFKLLGRRTWLSRATLLLLAAHCFTLLYRNHPWVLIQIARLYPTFYSRHFTAMTAAVLGT
jgi:hypothetical protein